jgi:cbb3-type cytochrome oxidase subunit 3
VRGYIKVCLYDIQNMADSELPTALILTNMFPTIMRYMIMIILYVIVFTQFKKPTFQFIFFIIVFILNFFTILFLYKEFISTPLLMKSFFEIYTERDPISSRNWATKFFVAIIALTALLFICSLSIILVVFDYGKKTTNDYKSYSMTPLNKKILERCKSIITGYNGKI